eukprot:2224994-Karenia_brevis.AAC.1
MAEAGPSAVIRERLSSLEHYARVKEELRGHEAELKDQMNPQVRHVVRNKSILLFKRMLQDI